MRGKEQDGGSKGHREMEGAEKAAIQPWLCPSRTKDAFRPRVQEANTCQSPGSQSLMLSPQPTCSPTLKPGLPPRLPGHCLHRCPQGLHTRHKLPRGTSSLEASQEPMARLSGDSTMERGPTRWTRREVLPLLHNEGM